MRATPSGGVGSIQDQGVNYIQLNIQPPIPLLNTELRNATLNKDYERSRPLDPAQLTAQPGQLWPPARPGWGSVEGKGASGGQEPAPAWRGGLAFGALSLLEPDRRQGRSWRSPHSAPPPGPPTPPKNRGSSSRPPCLLGVGCVLAGLAPRPRPSPRFPGRAACRRRGGAPGPRVQAAVPASPLQRPGEGAAFGRRGSVGAGPGARSGRWAPTSPHLGLKRAEGRGRPRGGPAGAQRLPGALKLALGRSSRGLPTRRRPSSCPPSARGAPHWWSGRSPHHHHHHTHPRAGNRRALQSRDVSTERALGRSAPRRGAEGRRAPRAPPLRVLPSRRPRPPGLSRDPPAPVPRTSPASAGPPSPSPGTEWAVAACGRCSNEKSEQLNRKIWIKKLEFNTHAPHLLKH